jgi:hypothetical protein
MTTDPKFQPLVDDLKNWLELQKQKETAKAAEFNSVMDAFRPTANYLEQLGKELKNNVDQTISIGLIGRWKEGPDQKFTVRYEVNFKGQVCHALLFTVQGRQIRIDDHVFVVGDQTALEETLGKTIVEAIKREASRRETFARANQAPNDWYRGIPADKPRERGPIQRTRPDFRRRHRCDHLCSDESGLGHPRIGRGNRPAFGEPLGRFV